MINTIDKIINKDTSSTNYLSELQQRIPTVSDKALINLVNGIQVSKDIIRYRKNRGFFGKLFDKLDGSNSKRRLLLDGNIIAGQEALHDWLLELTDSLNISQVALEVTQKSLLEARNAIRNQKQNLQLQEDRLNQLVQEINSRIHNIESRLRQLEIRVAATEDLDRIITAWSAGKTYSDLPWVIQVSLLAKEVFTSAVIVYELETGDTQRFRELLVNKIIATDKQLPSSFFGIGDLLDYSSTLIKEDERELIASLLEIRSFSQQFN
ncbi:MAG: diguanylate cyclase regulator RdcB family protein [Cyanobacteria bacterium P01_A01_bin.68]